MRQICPHCQSAIEVSPAAAGSDAECPVCGKGFPVPKAYTPTVSSAEMALPYGLAPEPPKPTPPAPPPGFVPPRPASAPPPPAPPADYEPRTYGFVLSPNWVGWVPAAALTVCLVLSFFPWVGSYPGGYRVFSQTAWEAAVGSVHAPGVAVPETVQKVEPELKALAPMNFLMLVYVALLVVSVVVAWAERVIPPQLDVTSVPGPLAWLPGVWPYRFAVLAGLAGLLLALVVIQGWRGFGLETAVTRYATAQHGKKLEEATTEADKQVARIQIGREAAQFAVGTTTAEGLAELAHVVAVLGVLARVWLDRRGAKPHPRFGATY